MPARRLKAVLLVLFVVLITAQTASPASAGKFFFGPQEKLHVIAKTGLDKDGKPLSLCYKNYTYYVFAGAYRSGDIVMCDDALTGYWPLPAGDQLEAMQVAGLLPKPIPTYEPPLTDYLIGYSLWIILPVIGIATLLGLRYQKAAAASEMAQLRLTARRILARVLDSSGMSPDTGTAVAKQLYAGMFRVPMLDAEFAGDRIWVSQQSVAYDGFLAAAGRKFKPSVLSALVQAAVTMILTSGKVEASAEEALVQLARRFGMSSDKAAAVVATMREDIQARSGAGPALST